MSEVSLIGLGPMGAALARVLRRAGHSVTVWNRTPGKAAALVREGAALAPDVAAAVRASPVVVVCIADYEATYGLLAETPLAGKLLVQLSTGTPRQAREGEAWARERGAEFLGGAIVAVPSQMGRAESAILVSGSAAAFHGAEALLRRMAGAVVYLGEPVAAAAAFDLGFLSYLFGGFLGFFHGARLVEAEGLRVDRLGSMLAELAPAIGEMIKGMGEAIQARAYANPESALNASAAALDLLERQAWEAGINAEFPRFGAALFRRAVAAGHGEEEVAALFEVLRADA